MVNFMLCIFYYNKNKADWGAILTRVLRVGLLEEVTFEQTY